ncbi:MAG TPA: FAD-dependent oxidoreductase [Burkholderiales bacterium]|nr:FAD-dependent oxidoreductase [Burkholderiales bacterium]
MKHVAVIGAGIVGASCAAWLQRKGMAVTLIERDSPGEATSFGNAGSLSPTAVTPVAVPGMIRQIPGWLLDPLGPLRVDPAYLFKALPWLVRFLKLANREDMKRCAGALRPLLAPVFDAYEPIVRRAEAQDLIRREGIVYVYDSEQAFLAAKPAEDDRRRLGAVLEDLTRADIERFAPELAPEFRWGTFAPENGFTINPSRLTKLLATSVAEHGGTLVQAEVLDLAPRAGGVTLKLRRGGEADELGADAVLVCAGAWSHFLAAKVGDKVPLETQRGYHVTVAEAGLRVNRMVNWVTRRVFTTPMEVGMRFAGTVEIAGLEAPPNWERADRLLELGRKMYPSMNTEKVTRWMGHRPCLPDSLPVIGPSPRAKNVFYAFGHGHIGMCSASGTARSIAELIAGETPQIDLSPFRVDRF